MKRIAARIILLAGMLLGLPLLGVWIHGNPVGPYLQFPPMTRRVMPAEFSWVAFVLVIAIEASLLWPCLRRIVQTWQRLRAASLSPPRAPGDRFPWWGWVGLALGALAWIMAWTRFEWFRPLQPHTFTPLWIAYILVVNALTRQRAGQCMITHRPRLFALLFPVSAAFWWFFEYLNRFVCNWHYVGAEFGPLEYFIYATLPFATVLPAVLGTAECLRSIPIMEKAFENFSPWRYTASRSVAVTVLILSGVGLLCIGIFPQFLFPLLWLAPLAIVLSIQSLDKEDHVFVPLRHGDWRVIMSAALGALVCGFFWEMWNVNSLAKWVYTVPLVHRFQVFEMPLAGYGGYLPFGVECLIVGEWIRQSLNTRRHAQESRRTT